MIVVDAGVVIAAWNPSDAHFLPAKTLFQEHPESRIHPVNLSEALVHPIAQGEESYARSTLRAIGVQETTVGPEHGFRLAHVRGETGLKMPDCCALASAEELGLPLATFDRRLAEVARERGVTVLP